MAENPIKKIKDPAPARRWLRNGELAKYLGVSKMYVWRLKHEKSHNFPLAAVINTIEWNDLDKVDAWMEARVQHFEQRKPHHLAHDRLKRTKKKTER